MAGWLSRALRGPYSRSMSRPKGAVAALLCKSYLGTRAHPVESQTMAPKIRFASRELHLPQSRTGRVGVGVLLVAGGLMGFLPVVGFWMLPLGLLVLSVDIPVVRRGRRRLALWWH